MPEACRLVILTPIHPAPSGNGLAMRAWSFVAAAAALGPVDVVVVPGAGAVPGPPAPLPPGAALTVAPEADAAQTRAGLVALLAEATWRDRWSATTPLPHLARLAPPSLAQGIAAAVPGARRASVHVLRSYLAPLGVALAGELDAPWVTLDLDDDDERLAAALDDVEESQAYGRLVRTFAPAFDRVGTASEEEAAAVAARYGLTVQAIPNSVPLPEARPTRPHRPQGRSLLFVGNLTYRPNGDAARALVDEVLPRMSSTGPVEVTIVGDAGGDPELLRLGERPGVRIAGFVPDVAPYYQAADVVVLPLEAGAGTRIKLLEAFAHGVPVVATPAAVSGLAAEDGVHLLVAETPAALAEAVARLLADGELAARLSAAAWDLVERSYSHAVVFPRIRAFLSRPS